MKKIDCIFYLFDNHIDVYSFKYKKLNTYECSHSIFEGRIIKPKVFIKKINEILKEEKISKILMSQSAIVLYQPHLKYVDKKTIIDSFEQCNFKDIKLINTKELARNNYIELNDNYLVFYKKKSYTMIHFNSYFTISMFFKELSKKNMEDIYLLGKYEEIEKIAKDYQNIYYFENSTTFFIDKILEKLTRNC